MILNVCCCCNDTCSRIKIYFTKKQNLEIITRNVESPSASTVPFPYNYKTRMKLCTRCLFTPAKTWLYRIEKKEEKFSPFLYLLFRVCTALYTHGIDVVMPVTSPIRIDERNTQSKMPTSQTKTQRMRNRDRTNSESVLISVGRIGLVIISKIHEPSV